jgi:hypothetical protein
MRKPESHLVRSRRTSISVLNPVAEVRESGSFHMLMSGARPSTSDYECEPRKANGMPAKDIIGAEAVKTLEDFYRQQSGRSNPTRDSSNKNTTSRHPREYIPFPVVAPLESQHTKLSKSSATAGSMVTQSHSHGVSSASTASSLRVTTPRNSSLSRVPPSLQQELAESSVRATEIAKHDPSINPNVNPMPSTDGVLSAPAIIATAATIANYDRGVDKVDELQCEPQTRSPAPSKTLIDISGARVSVISRPATAPPSQTRPVKTQILKRHTTTGQNNFLTVASTNHVEANDGFDSPPKTRQEQVKIKKSRDMALLYMESTKSRRKSAPMIYEHDRNYSVVSGSIPWEFKQYGEVPTRSKSNKKKHNSSITSEVVPTPPTNGKLVEEIMAKDSTAVGLGQNTSHSTSLPQSSGHVEVVSPALGCGASNTDSIHSAYTPLRLPTEKTSQGSSVRPRYSRPTSTDSLCDQIVSDFSMIARNNHRDKSAAPKVPSRASSIQAANLEQMKTRNISELSLSPIRTVAEFPEYTGYVADTDLLYRAPLANKLSVRGAHSTNSRSIEDINTYIASESSLPSSFLALGSDAMAVAAIPVTRLRGVPRHKSVESLRPRSILEERRHDRRMKRSNVLKEKTPRTVDLERRLSRVEQDNQILIRALTGIAAGVQELKLFYPKGQTIQEEA